MGLVGWAMGSRVMRVWRGGVATWLSVSLVKAV